MRKHWGLNRLKSYEFDLIILRNKYDWETSAHLGESGVSLPTGSL